MEPTYDTEPNEPNEPNESNETKKPKIVKCVLCIIIAIIIFAGTGIVAIGQHKRIELEKKAEEEARIAEESRISRSLRILEEEQILLAEEKRLFEEEQVRVAEKMRLFEEEQARISEELSLFEEQQAERDRLTEEERQAETNKVITDTDKSTHASPYVDNEIRRIRKTVNDTISYSWLTQSRVGCYHFYDSDGWLYRATENSNFHTIDYYYRYNQVIYIHIENKNTKAVNKFYFDDYGNMVRYQGADMIDRDYNPGSNIPYGLWNYMKNSYNNAQTALCVWAYDCSC